jgi:DinB superfamily
VLDAATLIRQTADERKKLVLLVEDLTETQASHKSAPDVWSVKENLEHLVIAEIYGVTKMWTAADGVRDGNPLWVGEHVNRGLSIDEVIARTWRPCETAPPGSTPRIGGPMLYWLESFRVSQLVLNRLESAFDGLDLEAVIIPHFISGPLDAAQRIDFLRFHIARHRSQVEKTMSTPGFPSA